MQYREKPPVFDVISFNDFVQHGRDNGGNIVSGMPWSFTYKGHAVTHENDECYLVMFDSSIHTLRFTPSDVLVTGQRGEAALCKASEFSSLFEPVIGQTPSAQPPVDNAHVAPGCELFSAAVIGRADATVMSGASAPRVTPAQIDALCDSLTFPTHVFPGTTTTVAIAVLPNGFTAGLGMSACVSPANFVTEIGVKYAIDQAKAQARDKLWELEGYALKAQLQNVAHHPA
ncbi:MAG: Gp49 family protein [Pseudomonadota bacterium]